MYLSKAVLILIYSNWVFVFFTKWEPFKAEALPFIVHSLPYAWHRADHSSSGPFFTPAKGLLHLLKPGSGGLLGLCCPFLSSAACHTAALPPKPLPAGPQRPSYYACSSLHCPASTLQDAWYLSCPPNELASKTALLAGFPSKAQLLPMHCLDFDRDIIFLGDCLTSQTLSEPKPRVSFSISIYLSLPNDFSLQLHVWPAWVTCSSWAICARMPELPWGHHDGPGWRHGSP